MHRQAVRHLSRRDDELEPRLACRRDLTGTEVRVGGELRRAVGTVSMDSFAVELDRELPVGTPAVLIGHGVTAESHAKIAGTITYELACGVTSDPTRARRTVIDA